jgi:gas vesicle protein
MYEPHHEQGSTGGGFLMGLLCGTALGAAIGLMFAPKAGSEFRQTLYESTEDLRRKAADAYGQASETVNTYVSKGKQAVEQGREAFENARETATEQGKEFFDKSRKAATEYTSTGSRTGATS